MILSVDWQYTILNINASSHRVARRSPGDEPPVYASGTDSWPNPTDTWIRNAPPVIHFNPDGQNYAFGFWWITGQETMSGLTLADVDGYHIATKSLSGGAWVLKANAYYVWKHGTGPGDEALYIDALDINKGFIPDDFVDVTPDGHGAPLTSAANNGYIDTSDPTQIPLGASINVRARDMLRGGTLQFGFWNHIDSVESDLDSPGNPMFGGPDPHDIIVSNSDDVFAFAFYKEVPAPPIPLGPPAYDLWWWIRTHGGLLPPKTPGNPPDPLAGALALNQVSHLVSPELRANVLGLTLEQLSLASTEVKREMKSLKLPTAGAVKAVSRAKRR